MHYPLTSHPLGQVREEVNGQELLLSMNKYGPCFVLDKQRHSVVPTTLSGRLDLGRGMEDGRKEAFPPYFQGNA